MSRLSKDTLVALAASVLLVVAMAIDHLVGTGEEPGEESGLADPGAFVLSVLLSLAIMAVLFRFVVRGGTAENSAARAILCSALAIPAIAIAFLGLPYPLAGAGIALGLRGRHGERRRLADAAIAIGSLVVVGITAGYIIALVA